MKDTARRARILGFSRLEARLFSELSEQPENVSELARRLKEPRTSLFRPLESLRRRGFVEPTTVGKRTWWKKVSQESLVGILSTLLTSGVTAHDSVLLQHPEFFLHKGKKALSKIYEVLGTCRNQRVLYVQPSRSLVSALNMFSEEDLLALNRSIKKNGVIMETILQENVVPIWIDAIKKRGWRVDTMVDAVSGRAADTTYVPKEFLNFDSEILIMSKVAYLVNWNHRVAIEVRSSETIGLLRDLFALAKYFGRTANLTELVEAHRESV